jgi:hypothetical protein
VDIVFSQDDFPYSSQVEPLIRRVTKRLEMTRSLSSVMIDVVDLGMVPRRNPGDSIEVYSTGGVRLHLRLDHFLKEKYRGDWRRRRGRRRLPACAFDTKGTLEVLYRLLLQWRDVNEWGIPENQDDEFLCLWNAHVAGRLERSGAPVASRSAHWAEFQRLFSGNEPVSDYRVAFEILWKCDDVGKWGITDLLYRIRESRSYRPLVAEKQNAA